MYLWYHPTGSICHIDTFVVQLLSYLRLIIVAILHLHIISLNISKTN